MKVICKPGQELQHVGNQEWLILAAGGGGGGGRGWRGPRNDQRATRLSVSVSPHGANLQSRALLLGLRQADRPHVFQPLDGCTTGLAHPIPTFHTSSSCLHMPCKQSNQIAVGLGGTVHVHMLPAQEDCASALSVGDRIAADDF